jgi:hypothetical protein
MDKRIRPAFRWAASLTLILVFLLALPQFVEDAANYLKTHVLLATIGQILQLDAGGVDVVIVPVDDAAEREYERSSEASDDLGISNLKGAGKLLLVQNGTRVRVIGHRWMESKYELRILEGEFKGKSGWVRRAFLRPLTTGNVTPTRVIDLSKP